MKLCDKCKYPCFQQCPAVNSDIEYGGEGTGKNTIIQCDVFENANLNEPRGVFPMDKSIEDFKQIAYNLRREGYVSRADAIMYLIERVKIAEGRCPGPHEMEEIRKDIKDFAMLFAECVNEISLNEIKPAETEESLRHKYLTDPLYHNKVQSILSPLLNIINKYLR